MIEKIVISYLNILINHVNFGFFSLQLPVFMSMEMMMMFK